MKKSCGILLLGGLLRLHPAQAQTAMDSILISENRLQLPYSKSSRDIQILDRRSIERLPVKSVNELLAYAAGIDMRQRGPWGTQGDLSIDGSSFDEVLVLIDGVKMSDPQTGHNLLNIPVPLSAIERIEVLRGAAARIYGVNALAGAVNIVTRLPDHATASAQAYAGSSFQRDTSNGRTYAGWGVQAAGTLAGKGQAHGFSLAHDRGNGYRYNTDFERYQLFYQNAIRTGSNSTLKAMGGYSSNRYGASLFYAAPGDMESAEQVQTASGSLSWEYKPVQRLQLIPRVSYRYSKDDYKYIRQQPEKYRNIHETNVLDAELNASYRLQHGTAGTGAEWRQEKIASNSLGHRERSNLGFYAEYRHFFTRALTAGAGVYVNHNSLFGTQALPGADASFSFLRRWKLFASIGTGQRLPTYTDLYYKGPANVGNDSLQPEHAVYTEGGLQYQDRFFSAQATYAYRHVSDFIDWVRASSTDPWQPQNYLTVNTRLFSCRATCALDALLRLPENYRVQLSTAYTYLDPSIALTDGVVTKYTTDALRHQWISRAEALLWRHVQVTAAVRYQQRLSANDYALLDARVGYRIPHFLFYADAGNLLDVQYKETGAVPLPGRWMTVGLRAEY